MNQLLSIWNRSRPVIDPFSRQVLVTKERSFVARAKGKNFSRTEIINFSPIGDSTFSYHRLWEAVNVLFPLDAPAAIS